MLSLVGLKKIPRRWDYHFNIELSWVVRKVIQTRQIGERINYWSAALNGPVEPGNSAMFLWSACSPNCFFKPPVSQPDCFCIRICSISYSSMQVHLSSQEMNRIVKICCYENNLRSSLFQYFENSNVTSMSVTRF